MKLSRFLLVLLSVSFLCSCANNTKTQDEIDEQDNIEFPIVDLVGQFVANNPNFSNNDLTKKVADERFRETLDNLTDTTNLSNHTVNIIRYIPVKLESMCESSTGNINVHFRSWIKPRNFEFPAPIKNVYFDIIASVKPEVAYSLKDNTYYTIEGTLISLIDDISFFKFLLGNNNTRVYTKDFNVRKEEYGNNYEVSLGMMYYSIDSITPYYK